SSSALEPRGVSPCAISCSRTAGSASALTISALSRATISGGVPAGASTANQELNSNPGRPDSDTVGTSGYCGMRLGVVTATSLTLLPRTSELTVASPWKATGTSAPATPTAACVAPLYGTWFMTTFASDANSAMAMCCGLPTPPDP